MCCTVYTQYSASLYYDASIWVVGFCLANERAREKESSVELLLFFLFFDTAFRYLLLQPHYEATYARVRVCMCSVWLIRLQQTFSRSSAVSTLFGSCMRASICSCRVHVCMCVRRNSLQHTLYQTFYQFKYIKNQNGREFVRGLTSVSNCFR